MSSPDQNGSSSDQCVGLHTHALSQASSTQMLRFYPASHHQLRLDTSQWTVRLFSLSFPTHQTQVLITQKAAGNHLFDVFIFILSSLTWIWAPWASLLLTSFWACLLSPHCFMTHDKTRVLSPPMFLCSFPEFWHLCVCGVCMWSCLTTLVRTRSGEIFLGLKTTSAILRGFKGF